MSSVSLVMITRDDARCVERALLSVRPYVDELVVLDLGSLDDTALRAQRCGARVEFASWSPDPSLLRNAALARAHADWHVVLEAGEWIDSGGAGLLALAETEPDQVGLVEVIRPGLAGRGLAPATLEPRILPGHVRYAGRYRDEAIYPGTGTWRAGVAVASDERGTNRWRHDRSRAEMALLQALRIHPDGAQLFVQLGENLRDQGRNSEAADAFGRALAAVADDEPWRHLVVVEALDAMRVAHRFAEAIRLMDAETARWSGSPDFTYVVGDLFFEILLAEPDKAAQLAPLTETCWRRCLEIGDQPHLVGTLTGRGSFLAAQSLSVLHLTLGRADEASRWFQKAGALLLEAGGA